MLYYLSSQINSGLDLKSNRWETNHLIVIYNPDHAQKMIQKFKESLPDV